MTPVRVSVSEDCMIEVEQFLNGRRTTSEPFRYSEGQIDSAIRMILFWTRNELEIAKKERFVPQADREAMRELRQQLKRSPFDGSSGGSKKR